MTSPKTMRGAVLLGPENIEIRDVPIPEPGDGEILLGMELSLIHISEPTRPY